MIIVICVYIIVIGIVYFKNANKNTSNYNDENVNEIEEIDPALIGYIHDKNVNPLNLLLSEILDLARKGYIEIKYVRKDVDDYEYIFLKKDDVILSKLEPYELTAYRLLFDETGREVVKMKDLEAEFVNERAKQSNAIVKGLAINDSIREKLSKEGIINANKENKIKTIKIIQIIAMIIIAIFFSKLKILEILAFLICNVVLFFMLYKLNEYTAKGNILHEKVERYADNLEKSSLLKEQKIVYQNLTQKHYINSVALNIASEALKEFIIDEEMQNRRKDIATSLISVLLWALYLIYIVIFMARTSV